MGAFIISVFVLLCVTGATLALKDGDFDCSTAEGQLAFLMDGAAKDPQCYTPIIDFYSSMEEPTLDQLGTLCKPGSCLEDVIAFLQKCSDNQEVKDVIVFFENQLCAFKDGVGKPQSSCAFLNTSAIEAALRSCGSWWFPGGSSCPLPNPLAGTTTPCDDALKASVEMYGCCFQNLFGTREAINQTTEEFEENLQKLSFTPPEDLEVDVTDPALFSACGVSLPGMCRSVFATTATTATTASAPSLAVAPLVILLFVFAAKLFAS